MGDPCKSDWLSAVWFIHESHYFLLSIKSVLNRGIHVLNRIISVFNHNYSNMSNMSKDLKIRFFIATIESILLYGCESWALSKAQEKSLDGTYTRMLRKALNIHWSSHIPNQQLYGDLPAVSNKIASRRLQLAGHCYRHPELSTQKLVLWEPTHGHRGRGRPNTTYIDTLKRDTGAFEASEIAALMADKRLGKI